MKRRIYIILFALLYIATAFVSGFHAIEFFSLANVVWIGVLLAITFEIGQAAVLFSILTSPKERRKLMPWTLMCILTLVQVIGNVYSSYKYLITNSAGLLKYFKEPIFVWTELPDAQCNVILTYIIGAILPIISLCMSAMVTNYLYDDPVVKNDDDDELPAEEGVEVPEEEPSEEPTETPATTSSTTTSTTTTSTTTKKPRVTTEKPKEKSHFINI